MRDDDDAPPAVNETAASVPSPRPRRTATRVVQAVWAVLALLLLVVATHPVWLAPLLGRYLTAKSGRAVHFDSVRLGLTASLAPVAHLRGVRIANAPWSDNKAPFAALADAVFVFAWTRFEDRHVVTYLLLRDGVVNLERRADGLRNWRLADPDDRGPGHFWFYSIEGHAATLAFVNQGIDLHFRTTASDIAPTVGAASEALPTRIDFDGAYRQVAFQGSVATGPVLTFLETGRWFGLRGHASIDGIDFDAEGRAADILRAPRVDAHVDLAGRSLAALQPLIGARDGEPRAFHLDGHLSADAHRYALADAHAKVGATDLAGDVSWSRVDERQRVGVHLKSEVTRFDDLLWLVGRHRADVLAKAPIASAAAASAPTLPSPPASAPAAKAERDLFAALHRLDADVAFEARRLQVAGLRAVQSLSLKASLTANQLTLSDVDLGWAGGHSTGRLALDLRQPVAAAEASIDTQGVRVENLLAAQDDRKRITGALRGHVALKASGNSLDALRASANGSASMRLSDGTISSLLDAELGLEGGKLMRTLISGVDFLPVPCAAASIDLKDGRASLRGLVIDSANTRTTGSGSIDLRSKAIELVLTPQPKRPGLFELQRSIRLSGNLPKPERALVDRVAPPTKTACDGSS